MKHRERSLFTIEETTPVPDSRLKTWLAGRHRAGGRLRRVSPPVTVDGEPGHEVTIAYREQ